MTYTAWQTYIEGADGLPVSGATIEVRTEATGALVTIYSDKDGAALANPFTSDSNGLARFYAPAGFYKITATSGDFTASFRFVPIGQAQGYDVGTSAGNLPTIALADVRYNPNLNHNLSATTAPTVDDDETSGYEVQSVWLDASVSPPVYYVCLDNTAGAAVWEPAYSTAASESTSGVVELATQAEATAGTDDSRAVTPLKAARAQIIRQAASVGGSGSAITVTCSPTVTAYTTGLTILFNPTNSNSSTTPTINVDGLGAKTIQKAGGVLAYGVIKSGSPCLVQYDGTNFQVLNPIDVIGAPAAQAYAKDSTLTFAHGLGVVPCRVCVTLICTSAELGYSVGHRVLAAYDGDGGGRGMGVRVDATNVVVTTSFYGLNLLDATSRTANGIADGKWDIEIVARE